MYIYGWKANGNTLTRANVKIEHSKLHDAWQISLIHENSQEYKWEEFYLSEAIKVAEDRFIDKKYISEK